ncbi:hypothetical protein JW906_10170 [bacterium]|nr:hypothetical protein [bacterium]
MWENETVVLITSLKKRLLGSSNKARYAQITADNAIPPFIKALFQKRVEEYLIQENPFSVTATPHFELTRSDLESMRGRFLDVLREAAVFPKDEVEEILRTALVLRLDYVVKPADTMRRLFFEKNRSIELAAMQAVLEPFSKLLPYADQLVKECRRLSYTELEPDEYNRMIVDLFQQATQADPVKVVLRDFSVLTDYLSETKGEEMSRVEGRIIGEFLADRNLWGFRRALDVELKLGKKDFTAADLEMTLKRYIELKAEFSREAEPAPEPTVRGKEKTVAEEMPALEDISELKEADDGWDLQDVLSGEPLGLITEEKPEPEPEPEIDLDLKPVAAQPAAREPERIVPEETEKPSRSPEPKKSKEEPKSQMRIIRRDQKEEVLKKKDVLAEEPAGRQTRKSNAVSGLRSLIDEKSEKVFIKKLFNGEKGSYEKLLLQLEEAESWRVAKILIDNELFKRDVDPFSREAIKLVDLVYGRFYPEEGVGGRS